jgi:hypothetical protein
VFSTGEGAASKAAFNYDGCHGPVIDQLFDMNCSNTGDQKHGLYCENGAVGHILRGSGFINCGDVGAYAKSGSVITARGCLFTGCRYGVFAFCNSHIDAAESDCSAAAANGVYANRGCSINFHLGTATGCGGDAIGAIRGSLVNAELATLTGTTGAFGQPANGAGIAAIASIVHARSANVSNSTGSGVFARQCSMVDFSLGNANSCGGFGAIHAFTGSIINADAATATNAAPSNAAILAERASIINFNAGNINPSSASPRGAHAVRASKINVEGANCRFGSTDSSDDIRVSSGGYISAAAATGGTSVTKNTISANGIIFG